MLEQDVRPDIPDVWVSVTQDIPITVSSVDLVYIDGISVDTFRQNPLGVEL